MGGKVGRLGEEMKFKRQMEGDEVERQVMSHIECVVLLFVVCR